MATEDSLLLACVSFLLVYALTVITSVSIILENRQRQLARYQIRCSEKRRSK